MQGGRVGRSAQVLSERDCVHLLELAWQHGFANWHAQKSMDAMWAHMRARTRRRIEVRDRRTLRCRLPGCGWADLLWTGSSGRPGRRQVAMWPLSPVAGRARGEVPGSCRSAKILFSADVPRRAGMDVRSGVWVWDGKHASRSAAGCMHACVLLMQP